MNIATAATSATSATAATAATSARAHRPIGPRALALCLYSLDWAVAVAAWRRRRLKPPPGPLRATLGWAPRLRLAPFHAPVVRRHASRGYLGLPGATSAYRKSWPSGYSWGYLGYLGLPLSTRKTGRNTKAAARGGLFVNHRLAGTLHCSGRELRRRPGCLIKTLFVSKCKGIAPSRLRGVKTPNFISAKLSNF